MNKLIPLVLVVGVVITLGCIGPFAETDPDEEGIDEGELDQSLQETEEALNSSTFEFGDLDLSEFLFEETL